MDKIGANNFIVALRKSVKNAKAMVAGNLVRQIKELKKKADNETMSSEIEAKIAKIHGHIKLLKDLDSYIICKKVMLKPDQKYWRDLVSNHRAGIEDNLRARVICKGTIQKEVAKFRSDHPDCDEWLEEYFEFREKKRQLNETKVRKGKMKKKSRSDKKETETEDLPVTNNRKKVLLC